jgi:dipeptidyl aminopeptidase/acylaminoacyl peptidase
VAALVCLGAAPAQGTFPGDNGKLVLSVQKYEQEARPYPLIYLIETVTPDPELRDWDLTQIETSLWSDRPRWSPDGSRIAFVKGDAYGNPPWADAHVVNADGSNLTRVADTPMRETAPAWSPDGSRIAFADGRVIASVPSGGNLWVMDADGSNANRLTQYPGYPGPSLYNGVQGSATVDWSPNGEPIGFHVFPFENNQFRRQQLHIINSDGTGQTALTDVDDFPGGAAAPSWSPDGSQVAFVTENGIEKMNVNGTGRTVISSAHSPPAWSPDGTKIAYAACTSVWVMNADGSNPQIVLSTPFGAPYSLCYTSVDWQALNRDPQCGDVDATPDSLWPPNRRLRVVELSGAADPDGEPVSISVTGVTQDERVRRGRDAYPASGDDAVRLRADGDPRGDGRVYRIAFEATDARGGSCVGTATVSVPRKKKLAAVDSAPPSYDSFGH